MKVGAITLMTLFLMALPIAAFAGTDPCASGVDTDGDTVVDQCDNCLTVQNAPPLNCDTDGDGYGNFCDGDFNQTLSVTSGDFNPVFLADFAPPGTDSGVGTDMNCNGAVTSGDFNPTFLSTFAPPGTVGPSGLSCAGAATQSCPTP